MNILDTSGNHASRDFLHKLNELRWSKTLVDVVLVGEEAVLEIPAHKLLLAACSPYFNSRLVDIFATFNHCEFSFVLMILFEH